MTPPEPPLVIFSPLPPAKSGIAAYTAELLPALCARRPVVLVCEKGLTPEVQAALSPELAALMATVPAPALRILSATQYATEQATLAASPHIYQIGNNRDHIFVYEAFVQRPGILVLHDFNLHYLIEDLTLVRGNPLRYSQILQQDYGEPGATLADLRQIGIFSEAQKLALPLNRHLLRQATGIIVHNQWVWHRLPAHVRSRALVLPHHYSPQVAEVAGLSQAEARQQLGLPAEGFIVLSLGFITPPKQIQSTLAALACLKRWGKPAHFVIAGERNAGFDIDGLIRQHGLEAQVTITGYVPESAFFRYIVAADCVVNLRHPTVGESSGTLTRALALGLPALVYNFGPCPEFPSDVVLKVPLELAQDGAPESLAVALARLLRDADLRQRMSQAASAYMKATCSVAHSAEAYLRFALSQGKAHPLSEGAAM